MEDLLFLARYPDDELIKDGMYQRIKNVDNLFSDVKRSYLRVTKYRIIKRTQKVVYLDNLTLYSYNLFFDFFKIKKILKSYKNIYIHSLYNFCRIKKYLNSDQNITLDFHGIVPEEIEFFGNSSRSKYFNRIEKIAVNKISNFIYVTNSMKKYLCDKYDILKNKKSLIFPIVAKNGLGEVKKGEIFFNNIDTKKDVVFVYSGNFQKWQRFDDVIKFINANDMENYKYIFLTGSLVELDEFLKECKVPNSRIIKKSCRPDELKYYYSVSNYGFLLRDDHPLNRVANPTKALEYMYYGITPIVDLVEIGDYSELGYEHIKYDDMSHRYKNIKSKKNMEIAKKIIAKNLELDNDFKKLVLGM